MTTNTKEYSHAYYLGHKAKIAEQHRLWYLKHREYAIKKQTIYNRKVRKAKRAARASQKPVRKSVRAVSQADTNGARNTAPKRGTKQSGIGKHGDPVRVVPQRPAPEEISPLNGEVSAQQTEMVPETIQELIPGADAE